METIDGHLTDDDASQAMPNQIDVHVGCCVWQRRTLLGLSQEKIGEALGLNFLQKQKYERSAGILQDLRSGDPKTPVRVGALPLLLNKHFYGFGHTGQLDASSKDCDKVAGSARGWAAFRYV